MKFSYTFVCVCVVLTCAAAADDVTTLPNGKIKITVGTTAGCSDTVKFFNEHLAETYEAYKEFLDLEIVPWGKTTYDENGIMQCQFGASDCFANRVHRCALNLLIGNQDAQMLYLNCEFTAPFPALSGSYLCAQAAGLNLVDLDYCVYTTGHVLDLAAQEAAREPVETINFIPTVHFNDVVNVDLHNQAINRLKSVICFALAENESTGVTSCFI